MSSANSDHFASFFPIWMAFISLSCLNILTRACNSLLNKSGETRHSCLVPDLREKVFSFLPLSMILAVGLPHMAFIMLRYIPSIPTLLRVFLINGSWILLDIFSVSVEEITCFLSFPLLMWCITLTSPQMLNNPWIPRINPNGSWCIILLILHCYICFVHISLSIFASLFRRVIGQ